MSEDVQSRPSDVAVVVLATLAVVSALVLLASSSAAAPALPSRKATWSRDGQTLVSLEGYRRVTSYGELGPEARARAPEFLGAIGELSFFVADGLQYAAAVERHADGKPGVSLFREVT